MVHLRKTITTLITLTVFLINATPSRAQSETPAIPGGPIDLPKNMKAVRTVPDRAAEDLQAHGIGLSENELLTFLKNGLPSTQDLPDRPPEKSQLVIDAMARLATMKSKTAVPVIMQIARFDRNIGAFKVVEYDVSKSSLQSRDDFRLRAYRLIQYNAITALGVIGDPQARELIRTILQQETAPGAQIQYAISLALLSDSSGIDHLVNLINLQNRRESAAAARAFYFITGQDFGYTDATPIRLRRTLPASYAQWWAQNRATFQPNPVAIDKRRKENPKLTILSARSARDVLKLAANYFDFNNELGTASAREQLHKAGRAWNSEFEKIANDPNEDLDVRMEAMNWYFEANRADPLGIFRKLRRDENPEIVDKANTLLQQIAEEEAIRSAR